MDFHREEDTYVAPEAARERVTAKDIALLALLMQHHPERAIIPPEPVIVIPEPKPVIVAPPEPVEPALIEIAPVAEEMPRPIKIQKIINATAKYFEITPMDMICRRRNKRICLPRQIAMYLCRALTIKSFPEIGRALGGKDHTTVMHGAKKIECLRAIDPELNDQVIAVAHSLGAELA